MPKTFLLLSLSMVLLGCAGRGSLPDKFPATLEHWHGMDRVEFLKDFNVTDYPGVHVDAVNTSEAQLPDKDSNTFSPVTKVLTKATEYFTAGVKDGLSRVPVDNNPGSSGNALVVHASVKQIDPGSAALRFWVNYGAGSVHVTVSGDVTDRSTGETLLRFETTCSDAAMTSLGLEGYEGLMAGSVKRCGKDVGKLLNAFTPVKK